MIKLCPFYFRISCCLLCAFLVTGFSQAQTPLDNFENISLEELANSIKEQGVIQPIVVRPDKLNDGKYEIIAGERRWLASQNAGLHEVPVVILNVDDVKSLEFAIVENVQRQDLNPIEEARGYQKLIDQFNYNQDKLCKFSDTTPKSSK